LKLPADEPDLDQLPGIYSPKAAASEALLILLCLAYDPLNQRPAVHQLAGVERPGRAVQQNLHRRGDVDDGKTGTPDTRFDILAISVASVVGD
jgi:hypothetical protein